MSQSWRRLRKATYEGLNRSASQAYHHIHNREAILLALALHNESKDPYRWISHINRATASSVLAVSYSTPPISSSDDPVVSRIAGFMHRLEHAVQPGEYMVEIFHWLIHVPAWLAKWKREALEWHRKDTEMFVGFYEEAKTRVVRCLVSFCILDWFLIDPGCS